MTTQTPPSDDGGTVNSLQSTIDMVDAMQSFTSSVFTQMGDGLNAVVQNLQRSIAPMAENVPGGAGVAQPDAGVLEGLSSRLDALGRTANAMNTAADRMANAARMNEGAAAQQAAQAQQAQQRQRQIDTRPTLTAPQRSYAEEARAIYANNRYEQRLPPYRDMQGAQVTPMSPATTFYRSNELAGLQMGIAGTAKAHQRPQSAGGINFGEQIRRFFKNDTATLGVFQGSIGKSYEFSQKQGEVADDYRSAVYGRAGLQQFVQAEQTAGRPVDSALVAMTDVGMAEREARHARELSSTASRSLGNIANAHMSQGTKYSPFIDMNFAQGPSNAGTSVSIKKFQRADVLGTYFQGLQTQLQNVDKTLTGGQQHQSAANDLRDKVNSIRDKIGSSLIRPEAFEQVAGAGVNITNRDVQGIERAQRAVQRAKSNLSRLHETREGDRIKLDDIARTQGRESSAFSKQQEQLRVRDQQIGTATERLNRNEGRYRTNVSNVVDNFSYNDISKMSRGEGSAREIADLSKNVASLSQGINVIEGTGGLTRAQRVEQSVDRFKGSAGEFSAAMLQNLQWSLMFAVSGTVFQALSQIPTQATYETVQPMYSGVSNLTGLSQVQNEFMSFGTQAPQIMADLQSRTNALQSLMGSQSASREAVSSALDIARSQPIQFGEAMEIMTAMATYPSTKASARDPQFQQTMFENVQLLSMLAPEQGTSGALFAIREMLGGQFRSMQMRFNMSPELLASYGGSTVSEMKAQSGAQQMQTMNRALRGMFGGDEILMRRGAETQVQLRNIGDSLTASIVKPMVMESNNSISEIVSRLTNSTLTPDGGRTDATGISLGSLESILPESQVKAIASSALQGIAIDNNVRYNEGDDLDALATKISKQTGADTDPTIIRENLEQDYRTEISASTQQLYGTSAGGIALAVSALNTGLDNILSALPAASGVGGMVAGMVGSVSDRAEKYNTANDALSINNTTGRQKLASDFIQGLLTDVQDAIRQGSNAIQTSELSNIMKQVTNTVRIGAEAVFAPVGEVIMAQTFQTASRIPGMMVGGAVQMAGGALWDHTGGAVLRTGRSILTGEDTDNPTDGERSKKSATESMLRAGSMLSNMAAWGSLMNLRRDPLGSLRRFTSFSAGARGMEQLANGDGAQGLSNVMLGTAISTVPLMASSALSTWVQSSIVNAGTPDAAGARTTRPTGAPGTGYRQRAVTGLGRGIGVLGGLFGAADIMLGVNTLRGSSGDPNMTGRQRARAGISTILGQGGTQGARAAQYVGSRTSGMFSRAANIAATAGAGILSVMSAIPGRQGVSAAAGKARTFAGKAASVASRGIGVLGAGTGGTGFLGSAGGRALSMLGGGLAMYHGGKGLLSSEETSGTEKIGSFFSVLGGAATAIAPFTGAFAPATFALGVLASAAGGAATHIGKTKREERQLKTVDTAKTLASLTERYADAPVRESRRRALREFDGMATNYSLASNLGMDWTKNARSIAGEYATFIPQQQSDAFTNTRDKLIATFEKDYGKTGIEAQDMTADFFSKGQGQQHIATFINAALANPEKVYELNSDGTASNKIRPDVQMDLQKALASGVGLEKESDRSNVAERIVGELLRALQAARPDFESVGERAKQSTLQAAPIISSAGIQGMYDEAWRTVKVTDTDARSQQQFRRKSAEFAQSDNDIMARAGQAMQGFESTGIGLAGMDPDKVFGFRRAMGEQYMHRLRTGNVDPAKMRDQNYMTQMISSILLAGYDMEEVQKHTSELGDQDMARIYGAAQENQKTIDKYGIRGLSDRQRERTDIFSDAFSKMGQEAGGAVGAVESLSASIANLRQAAEQFDKAGVQDSNQVVQQINKEQLDKDADAVEADVQAYMDSGEGLKPVPTDTGPISTITGKPINASEDGTTEQKTTASQIAPLQPAAIGGLTPSGLPAPAQTLELKSSHVNAQPTVADTDVETRDSVKNTIKETAIAMNSPFATATMSSHVPDKQPLPEDTTKSTPTTEATKPLLSARSIMTGLPEEDVQSSVTASPKPASAHFPNAYNPRAQMLGIEQEGEDPFARAEDVDFKDTNTSKLLNMSGAQQEQVENTISEDAQSSLPRRIGRGIIGLLGNVLSPSTAQAAQTAPTSNSGATQDVLFHRGQMAPFKNNNTADTALGRAIQPLSETATTPEGYKVPEIPTPFIQQTAAGAMYPTVQPLSETATTPEGYKVPEIPTPFMQAMYPAAPPTYTAEQDAEKTKLRSDSIYHLADGTWTNNAPTNDDAIGATFYSGLQEGGAFNLGKGVQMKGGLDDLQKGIAKLEDSKPGFGIEGKPDMTDNVIKSLDLTVTNMSVVTNKDANVLTR